MGLRASICHYSFHRLWAEERWDCDRLCGEIKALGAEGVDFHQRLTGDARTARERIAAAIKSWELQLSGVSLSNNFNRDSVEGELDACRRWIDIAADLQAPVCRIFGGGPSDGPREAQFRRVREALKRAADYAAGKGVILALENHDGIPGTGEEQARMVREVASPAMGATVDVGNYLLGGQEAADGTAAAAPTCRYVHFKDYMKVPSATTAWGWVTKPCTVGVGAVDHEACLRRLVAEGYTGWVALEYEGPGPERIGVEESLHYMRKVMRKVGLGAPAG